MVAYRDPYPSFREKAYWVYRKYLKGEDIPPKSWVQLSCPNAEGKEIIATEHTEPLSIDRDVDGGTGIWTYDCDNCGDSHSWLWGPPAPIHLADYDPA